jgi:eukaryotic-like serine/threonine-protein kinase
MDPEAEAARRVGTTLCNKWTLDRLIGTGGMAAVYVASHKIGRREAIKILHSDVARDPELRARFEQEADAVNRFKHPGAVEVRDIDVAEDGTPFLVMELLDGQPLAERARQPGGVELGELLRLMDELLDVLVAAHAQGIIHRDIKPDNLFVLQDGRLKVLDFGIARVRAGAQTKLTTRVGATLGTAPYMPPEQIRGVEIDARADVFAVGATMFRLIAKRRIHDAGSEAEMLVKMASLQAPPLSSAAPAVPRDVGLVVDRALMFDREQRYPDALTMQGDVRALREGKAPPYATARAGEGGPSATSGSSTLVPSPSDAITRDAPTRPPNAGIGTEQTALARSLAPAPEQTTAASPGALHTASAANAVTAGTAQEALLSVPSLGPSPSLDPVTHPAAMVLGAAGLGDLFAPSPAGADAVSPALAPTHDGGSPASPPVLAPSGPTGERTLRSVQTPELAGMPVAPQGYVVATAPMPVPRASGPRAGPRTQVAGVAPPPPPPSVPLAPGESIPILAAPPPPRRRHTLPGTEISVVPLLVVGVLFAAIGVGVTLWFTLLRAGPNEGSTAPSTTSVAATATATAPAADGESDIHGTRPGQHSTHGPSPMIMPPPPHAPPPPPHGHSKH